MSAGDVQYLFLPYLRRGLAAAIRQDATGPRATLDVKLQVGNREEAEWPTKRIALYGPGDILGFDARIVVRTEPRPNIGDFERNYFPFIEFAEPDFPWRFTAAGRPSDDTPGLKPWIALIVLRTEEVEEPDVAINPTTMDEDGHDPDAQVPRITVSTSSLPDLAEAGRWAHVQVTGYENEFENPASETLSQILENEPERVVSRLLCARRLRPGVKYTAYVVPTFKLGKDAANPSSEAVGVSALEPAWSHSDKDKDKDDVTLPYYYKWEFRTGRRGDFEHLVRRLEPRALSGLGLREVDCQHPGYGLTGPEKALGFESALKTIDIQDAASGEESQKSEPVGVELEGLCNLLNLSDHYRSAAESRNGNDDPKVVPPLYGRWHKAQSQVDSEEIGWFEELNLDPRYRWAASLGAEVVRKQQEQLMASAWDQLGDIEAVNEILRRAQFAREVATKAEARLNQLPSGDYLRATAPLLGLVEIERAGEVSVKKTTGEQRIHDSPIRKAPLDPALRRVGRKRGSLRKHQRKRNPEFGDVLERLNQPDRPGGIRVVSKAIPARGVPTLKRVAGDIGRETQLTITSEPPQEESRGKFSYVLTYDSADGGEPEIKDMPGWLDVSLKEDRVTLEGTPPEPPIAKGALTSKLESYHVSIRVKDQIQSFDLNVRAKKNPSTQAIASGVPSSPLVYVTAVNVSTKIAEFCGEDWATNLKTRLSEAGELDATASAVVAALDGWLKPAKPAPPEPSPIEDKDLLELRDKIKADLRPAKTVAEHVGSRFQRSGPAVPEAAALNHITANPEFPQPMWGALEELSQEYLLAGISKVPQNTIALMETNRRFVEAYLCGLNHEFSRELLWREYPTDQRGSYFRQFWDKSGYAAQGEEIKDILPILQWEGRLGNNAPETSRKVGDDSLVLLLRGDLLNKYPNTMLYLAKPATPDGGVIDSFTERRDPIFAVTARPDIACIGFDLSAESVIDEGWYLVLEERISEARFGLDDSSGSVSGVTLSDLSWDDFAENGEEYPVDKYLDARISCMESAAAVASITMQDPVRVVISAKQMIPPIACVSGRIATKSGQAISGAAVSVGEKSTRTDQEGRFDLDRLPLGAQRLTVRHPDYLQCDKQIRLGCKPSEVHLEMIPLPGMISGRVTDHLGNGLGGVRVFYATGKETITNGPKGDYELAVPVGDYTVTAELDGFKPESKPASVESRATTAISFSLTPTTGTVSVKVTDHQGKILQGARVAAGGKETRGGDSDGVYKLTKLAVGNHKLSVELAGFETQWRTVTVEGGKLTSPPPFSLIPTTGAISGTVRGRGNDLLPGVTIVVGGRSITTKTGEFVLESVPVGGLTLTFSHPNYVKRSLDIELKGGETKVINETLSLLLGIVEGTVRKLSISNGRRVTSLPDGAQVKLGSRSEWTKNGRYRFDNVSAGSHQVSVSYPGCSAPPQTVEVQGGGRKEGPVDFTLVCLSLGPGNLKF